MNRLFYYTVPVLCLALQLLSASARAAVIPCRTCGTFLAGGFTNFDATGSQPGLQPLSHPLTLTINSPQDSVSLDLGEIQPGASNQQLVFSRANTDPAEWDAYHAELQKNNLGQTNQLISPFLGPYGTTAFASSTAPNYPYHEFDLQEIRLFFNGFYMWHDNESTFTAFLGGSLRHMYLAYVVPEPSAWLLTALSYCCWLACFSRRVKSRSVLNRERKGDITGKENATSLILTTGS